MKFTAFIFVIYILALAIVPCTDETTSAEVPHEHHTDNQTSPDDCCTPFCICACCGVDFPLVVTFFDTSARSVIKTPYIFSVNILFSQDYIGAVWHPPAQTR